MDTRTKLIRKHGIEMYFVQLIGKWGQVLAESTAYSEQGALTQALKSYNSKKAYQDSEYTLMYTKKRK